MTTCRYGDLGRIVGLTQVGSDHTDTSATPRSGHDADQRLVTDLRGAPVARRMRRLGIPMMAVTVETMPRLTAQRDQRLSRRSARGRVPRSIRCDQYVTVSVGAVGLRPGFQDRLAAQR
jgi:hypothetical protein